MDKTTMINLVFFACVGGGFFCLYKAKTLMPIIGANVKENFFTPHALIIALLYNIAFYGVFHWVIILKLNSQEGSVLDFSTYAEMDESSKQTNRKGK